jgi:hypothetical protein
MRVGRHKSRFLGGDAISTQYDAIVVGSGHNGLTCACYLAKDPASRRPRGRNTAEPIYSDLNLDFRVAVATKKTAKS